MEPVAPIRRVLERNLSGCGNVDILPYALGAAEGEIRMGNATVRTGGYFGTGQNFVMEAGAEADVEFTAEMRRGSELFGHLTRIDFIKCDVEGYEVVIMEEMPAAAGTIPPHGAHRDGRREPRPYRRAFHRTRLRRLHAPPRAGDSAASRK